MYIGYNMYACIQDIIEDIIDTCVYEVYFYVICGHIYDVCIYIQITYTK